MDKTKGLISLQKYIFILIVFCSYIFTGTLNAGKTTEKFKLNKVKAQLVKKIDLVNKHQNYLGLANKEIATTFPGLIGLDLSEAVFSVLQMATKDMDDDIRLIMEEIKSMTAAKKKLRELLQDLNSWISESMSKSGNKKGGSIHASGPVTYAEPQPDIDDPDLVSECRLPRPVLKKYSVTRNYRFKYPILSRIKYLKNYRKCPKPFLKKLKKYYEAALQTENEISEELSLKLQIARERRAKIIQTLSVLKKKISDLKKGLNRNIK